MYYTNFTCQFPGQPDLDVDLVDTSLSCEKPSWASFKEFPCPGKLNHCVKKGYCRLACEMNFLVDYFSRISSFEQGYIYIFNSDGGLDNNKIIIQKDAQNIFFYTLWLTFLRTPCKVLKFHQQLRANYIITTDIHKLFYTLFSIFLVDSHFKEPQQKPHLKTFKEQLHLVHTVLENLLERMRENMSFEGDACNNGLVLFDSLVQQIEQEFELFYLNLKQELRIQDGL